MNRRWIAGTAVAVAALAAGTGQAQAGTLLASKATAGKAQPQNCIKRPLPAGPGVVRRSAKAGGVGFVTATLKAARGRLGPGRVRRQDPRAGGRLGQLRRGRARPGLQHRPAEPDRAGLPALRLGPDRPHRGELDRAQGPQHAGHALAGPRPAPQPRAQGRADQAGPGPDRARRAQLRRGGAARRRGRQAATRGQVPVRRPDARTCTPRPCATGAPRSASPTRAVAAALPSGRTGHLPAPAGLQPGDEDPGRRRTRTWSSRSRCRSRP